MFGKIFRQDGRLAGQGRAVRSVDLELVENSDLFDPAWYASRYGIGGTPSDLARHFLSSEEVLDPGPRFSSRQYLKINDDVAASGGNALLHFEHYGRAEGRKTAPADPEPVSAATVPSGSDLAVVRDGFEPDFYRATNADLVGDDAALLDHFLAHGWREGRDPCRGFSIEYYLAANPDVRARGVNPFLHYLQEGRAEGRYSRPSNAPTRVRRTDVGTSDTAHLRCGVVALVRNEIDIIKPFAEHLLALFDEIVLVDHRSDDGTLEFLLALERASGRVTVLRFDEPGYHQALVINHVLRSHDGFASQDWLFMLDADEFLPFADRAAFHAALSVREDAPVISMRWRNLIPATYWEFEVDRVSAMPFLKHDQSDAYEKVAFQPGRIDRARDWVTQGNHSLCHGQHGLDHTVRDAGFALLHLPVRSANQLRLKLNQGVLSYLRMGAGRDAAQGSHWFRLHERLKGLEITPDILNTVINTYGTPPDIITPSSPAVLKSTGYSDYTPEIANAPLDLPATRKADVADLIFRATADAATALSDDHAAPIAALVTMPDGRITRVPEADTADYPPLGRDARGAPEMARAGDDYGFLAEFLRPSYWDIDDLTPSAWTGHIPFLFCLVAMERPRRYAELGTHFGASFFAYCQAAVRLGLTTEPVAIDAWMGDEHAGYYDEDVFNRFRYILRKYESFADYLRMTFDDAAPCFADGSLDLVHVDGLHTYEAVRHDFETWLPKMSARGVMILHDINVHERDFGVWKFWEELRPRYPTLEFMHSHGLGVVYVGQDADAPIARLIELTKRAPAIRTLVQQHFEEVSQKSAELFVKRWDLKQMQDQVAEVARLNQQVSELQQALRSAEYERDELRGLMARDDTRQGA